MLMTNDTHEYWADNVLDNIREDSEYANEFKYNGFELVKELLGGGSRAPYNNRDVLEILHIAQSKIA